MELIKAKKSTIIHAELYLCFEDEIDLEHIKRIIDIPQATTKIKKMDCSNSSESCQYYIWSLKTIPTASLSVSEVLEGLSGQFNPRLKEILSVQHNTKGFAKIYIVVVVENDEIPEMCIDEKFISIANSLGASIEMDMYINR